MISQREAELQPAPKRGIGVIHGRSLGVESEICRKADAFDSCWIWHELCIRALPEDHVSSLPRLVVDQAPFVT